VPSGSLGDLQEQAQGFFDGFFSRKGSGTIRRQPDDIGTCSQSLHLFPVHAALQEGFILFRAQVVLNAQK
jgi:hypothetical protein